MEEGEGQHQEQHQPTAATGQDQTGLTRLENQPDWFGASSSS
jgi:hypothetical protein